MYIHIKRFLDIFAAAIALVAFSPLLLIVAALVRLTSKGPAISVNELKIFPYKVC